jgi:putative membrane protein
MARWIVAFCRSLQVHLQEEADITALLLGKLPMAELTALAQAEHRPLKVLSLMSQLVARADIEPWQRLQLGDTISTFYDAVGGCERILRTPIPLSYTR